MASYSLSFRGASLLLVASLVLSPGAVLAEPSPADKETARSLMDDGDKKSSSGDLQGALKSYKAADDIMGVPTTAFEVARVQIKLGLLVEARDTLQRLMRIPKRAKEPAAFSKARAEAARLNDEIQPKIPSLQVSVGGLAAGVVPEVTIDGEALPAAAVGLPRKLNPGIRRVVASAKGYESVSIEVKLIENDTRTVSLQLRPASVEPPPAASSAAVIPTAPPAVSSAPPPPPTATTTATFSVPPAGQRRPALVYGGFGLGILGVTFGAVSGLISLNKASSVKDKCDGERCPEAVRDDIVSTKNWALASDVGFAVGVAGAGVGLIALLMGSGSASTAKRPSVEPVVGLGNLGLQGKF